MARRTFALIMAAALLAASCGGEREAETDPLKPVGELRAPGGIVYGFSGTTAGVVNTRNALTWNGVAMPGVMQLDIFGEEVEFDSRGYKIGPGRPAVTLTIPCGPDGDFYAGRSIVPASFSLTVSGMDVYPPPPYVPYCRVTLLDNPMETETVDYEVRIAFEKDAGPYEVEVSGVVSVPGAQLPGGRTAGYPALPMPEQLEFHLPDPDTVFTPQFIVVVDEEIPPLHQLVVFAFPEPCEVADPRKAEQTYFSFSVPVDLIGAGPVPAGVTGYVHQRGDDLTYAASPGLGWASLEYALDDSTGLEMLRGELLFQNNGSQEAVSFFGGGHFSLSVKDIISSS